MPRKNKSSEKEYYKLWWEYLRRSPKYKEYCSKRDSLHPEKDIFFERGFQKFGNVHTNSFEEWWEKRYTKPLTVGKNIEIYELIEPLEEYDQIIFEDFMKAFEDFKNRHDREPSFHDFFIAFPNFIREYHPYSFFLKININETYDIESIVKEFRNFLNKRKGGYPFTLWGLPTQPIRKDELSRYLQVYDLRMKKTKWKDILKIVYSEKIKEFSSAASNDEISMDRYDEIESKKEALERSLYADFKKANKIIENVEMGQFPGEY